MIDRFKNCRTITELVSLSYEEPLTLVQKIERQNALLFLSRVSPV